MHSSFVQALSHLPYLMVDNTPGHWPSGTAKKYTRCLPGSGRSLFFPPEIIPGCLPGSEHLPRLLWYLQNVTCSVFPFSYSLIRTSIGDKEAVAISKALKTMSNLQNL